MEIEKSNKNDGTYFVLHSPLILMTYLANVLTCSHTERLQFRNCYFRMCSLPLRSNNVCSKNERKASSTL